MRDEQHQRAAQPNVEDEYYEAMDVKELDACAHVSSAEYTRGMARRVETQMRADWMAVPMLQNLHFRHTMLRTPSLRVRHEVADTEAAQARSKELCEAAACLYHRLWHGYMVRNGKRRKIDGDSTKLRYAENLTATERELLRNLGYIGRNLPGTQQARLQMGSCLFGARTCYGDGVFITISPSERHSGLSLRLSRSRKHDVWLEHASDDQAIAQELAAWSYPSLEGTVQDDEDIVVEMPEYSVRRCLHARDPLAAVDAFHVLCYVVLARLLGIRMCPRCPRCNANDSCSPCQNNFGSNMRPMGGVFGGCDGFGGGVESQRAGTLHLHLKAHIISAFQHLTLQEIADLVRQNLLSVDAVKQYHEWAMYEDTYDSEAHKGTKQAFETAWKENFRGPGTH